MEGWLFGLLQLLLLFAGIVILVTSIRQYPLLSIFGFIGVVYLIYYMVLKYFFDDRD